MIFEELVSDQKRTLAGLREFLGVDPGRFPRLKLPHRSAGATSAGAAVEEAAGRAAMRAYFEPLHGELEELLGRKVPWRC